MMGRMSRDWERLGAAVKRSREDRGMYQADLAEAVGVEVGTIQNLETARHGRGFSRIPPSAALVAEFFRWPPGAVRALLDGQDVDLSPVGKPADAPETAEEESSYWPHNVLPLSVVSDLEADGQLIAATTLDLTPPGSKTRMIVVVKGEPDASPEEIRQSVLAWREAQKRLQGMGNDAPNPPVANGA